MATSPNLEIGEKYKRLTQDYAKVKKQLVVLRESFRGEQEKRSKLEEAFRGKELNLRKALQENEALDFRNQQLSKRVMSLQEELQQKIAKHKKLTEQTQVQVFAAEAEQSELARKIEENEHLHRKIEQLKEDTDTTISDLKTRLASREKVASRAEEMLCSLEEKFKSQTEEMRTENAVLQGKLDKSLNDVRIVSKKLEESQFKLLHTSFSGQSSLSPARSPHPSSGGNSPILSRAGGGNLKSVVKELSEAVMQFGQYLTNYHSYLEQRLFQFSAVDKEEKLSPVNQQFLALLKQSKHFTRPLKESIIAFSDILHQGNLPQEVLKEFAVGCGNLAVYLERLLPFHQLSLKEESDHPSSGQKLQERNVALKSALSSLPSVLNCVHSYCTILTSERSGKFEKPFLTRFCTQLQTLLPSLNSLHSTFSSKVTLEYQIPTVSSKLKTTNECILSSLNGLCNSVTKVHHLLDEHSGTLLDMKTSLLTADPRRDSKTLILEKLTAKKDASEQLFEEEKRMRESLQKDLQTTRRNITKLEEDKEQLLVEIQLLKLKLERGQKQLPVTQGSGGSSQTKPAEDAQSTLSGEGSVTEEELVQKHFAGRIAELSTQLQQSEGQSLFLANECTSLQRQLTQGVKHVASLEGDLEEYKTKTEALEDEIKTLSKNYETQLSVMSDHMCSLNDQLMRKSEEVQNSRQVKKKTRK